MRSAPMIMYVKEQYYWLPDLEPKVETISNDDNFSDMNCLFLKGVPLTFLSSCVFNLLGTYEMHRSINRSVDRSIDR